MGFNESAFGRFFLFVPLNIVYCACRLILPILCVLLVACGSVSAPIAGMSADAYADWSGASARTALPAQLNPALRYLKVEVSGHPPALMVLGYLEQHTQGEIEVWYSGEREVVKLQNGRLVGTAGLTVDWRSVQYRVPPPAWSIFFQQPIATRAAYDRVRDVMPGYRAGVEDRVDSAIGVPPKELAQGLPPASVTWVEERSGGKETPALPSAWFAIQSRAGQAQVVLSYQCVAASLCMRMQPWPSAISNP